MASKKLTAAQMAQKLAKIALKNLSPLPEEEQEQRIGKAEKRVATFSRGNRQKASSNRGVPSSRAAARGR
jgi:hypothetical protein